MDYKLLYKRRFYVVLDGKKSMWRKQKNGLPQGSVLAPLLFNIYTNLFTFKLNILFMLTILVKGKTFEEIERILEEVLSTMGKYYKENSLKPRYVPGKKLNVSWGGQNLEHTEKAKYLGVVLNRSLT